MQVPLREEISASSPMCLYDQTQQSGQLGKTLLHSVLPQDGLIHYTVSSSDPRALALYIRAGMRPYWPHFALRLEKPAQEMPLPANMEIVEADPADPALVRWDAQISGRMRPIDLLYWVREERAVPLWFRRQGQTVGYGYIRLGAGTLWHPQACTLGTDWCQFPGRCDRLCPGSSTLGLAAGRGAIH